VWRFGPLALAQVPREQWRVFVDDDEQEIRELIQGWATAVHDGDLEGVLADHAEEIVMFDVPPPDEGVRGLEAYSRTWPPFFEWQQSGASFDCSRSKS
jgi:ketosteroid isomerase-like protein